MSGGALVSYAGAAAALALAIILLVEGRLLQTDRPPITSWTRAALNRWPIQAIGAITLVLMGVSALWAHFVWDRTCG